MSQLSPVKIERKEFWGWQAVHLDNGIVHLTAVPDIGGRVMALDFDGYAFLYVDPNLAGKTFTPQEHIGDGSPNVWKNYGGDKTWPAPQGWDNEDQWHGPPDPILDGGPYQLEIIQDTVELACIQMTSAVDPHTGIQIQRRLTLRSGSSRVQLDLSFTNASDRPRRWSIWDVTQMNSSKPDIAGGTAPDSECGITAPLNPNSRFPDGYHVLFAREDNPQWIVDREKKLFVARYLFEIGKVGLDSAGGWIAFHNGTKKLSFVVNFPYFEGAEYPDGGASLECWTVGRGKIPGINYDYENSGIYLMETEVLSPLFEFQPGETKTFSLEWGVCHLAGMVVEAPLVGPVSEPFKSVRCPEGVHLTGQFGVYDQGILEVVWLDEKRKILATQCLGAASPHQPVSLDRILGPAPEACFVQLQVLADADGVAHILAEARL